MGRILSTAPNTVQRHLETLRDASTRAMQISNADGVFVPETMHDVRIETRGFPAPLFYRVERLSARDTR